MDDSLERQLVNNYSDLYTWYDREPDSVSGPVPPITVSGFSVGDGWFDLLLSLSETITQQDVSMEVHQVKEKYGGLRFYHGGIKSDNESDAYIVSGAIRHAENMSYHVCEECGDTGEIRTNGWYRTLCDNCWTEENARRRNTE